MCSRNRERGERVEGGAKREIMGPIVEGILGLVMIGNGRSLEGSE